MLAGITLLNPAENTDTHGRILAIHITALILDISGNQ